MTLNTGSGYYCGAGKIGVPLTLFSLKIPVAGADLDFTGPG